jgi:hypothetical protein
MNAARIADELGRVAAQPGIVACALVDGSTGLVWHVSGASSNSEHMWEAAVDYWRLHNRQKAHFTGLGPLGAAVMYHAGGVLAVLPCCDDPDVLFVSHGQHANVDWIALQRLVRTLGQLLRISK